MCSNQYFLFFLFIGGMLACSDQTESSWRNNLDKITQLNCRATELREARFTLADSMRYYQDSIMEFGQTESPKAENWKATLSIMDKRKTWLAETSRNLSDTIRVELLKLTGEMSVEEKRVFNDSLQAKTAALNCM